MCVCIGGGGGIGIDTALSSSPEKSLPLLMQNSLKTQLPCVALSCFLGHCKWLPSDQYKISPLSCPQFVPPPGFYSLTHHTKADLRYHRICQSDLIPLPRLVFKSHHGSYLGPFPLLSSPFLLYLFLSLQLLSNVSSPMTRL